MDSTQEYYDQNMGDDDSFYAELKQQIMQLTADDEEEDCGTYAQRNKISNYTRQSSSNSNGFRRRYFDWTENEKAKNLVPNSILNLWRNGNAGSGTGVFIPDIVRSRRRNKPRRRKNERGGNHKPVTN